MDNAEDHISFREEYPYAIVGSDARAGNTIEQLGLKREELAEFRRDALARLKGLIECYRLLVSHFPAESRPPDVQDQVSSLRALLTEATLPKAQYSLMAKAAIGDLLQD